MCIRTSKVLLSDKQDPCCEVPFHTRTSKDLSVMSKSHSTEGLPESSSSVMIKINTVPRVLLAALLSWCSFSCKQLNQPCPDSGTVCLIIIESLICSVTHHSLSPDCWVFWWWLVRGSVSYLQ